MGYIESLLADGERILLQRRQHWLAVVLEGRAALALVAAGIVLIVLTAWAQLSGTAYQLLGALSAVLVIAGLAWFAYRWWGWRAQAYLVTNRRVVKVEGIVNKRAADSSLEKINDAVLTQDWLGRLLGYGKLEILTAADLEVDVFTMLAAAAEFKREMLNAKYALETDIARPAAASPALRATDLSRGEATDLLARLAELRESGAITPEEYEAKKRDLLERI
jgi:uncharacterized membrane protein YdbT with pleckstrin-like domain